MMYAQHTVEFGFLWGQNGAYPEPTFKAINHLPSLFALSSSTWFAAALYAVGAGVSVAFTLGWHTRITAPVFWLTTWSFYARNPFVLDGGDNLLYLLAFYMIFADCGAALSFDAAHKAVRKTANRFAALLHNYALLAIMIQLCLLYFTSGFFKAQGHVWQDGTAIYYILRDQEFSLSPLAGIFWRSAAIVTLLTWSTMVLEISWPVLVWGRRTRFWVVAGAVLMHLMIAYFMGLVWFSLVMISANLVAFDDSEYRRLGVLLRRTGAALRPAPVGVPTIGT